MFRFQILSISLWLAMCSAVNAIEISANFTGSANFISGAFGLSGFGLPVTGSFYYDTETPPSTSSIACSGAGCNNYEQQQTAGFSASIGGVNISADNYLVQIRNDFNNLGFQRDSIAIIWRSDLTPSLAPLQVNGSNQSTGIFRIDLTALDTLFSNASLPNSLSWSDFSTLSPPGVIGNSVTIPNAFITLNSLTYQEVQSQTQNMSIPEPSTRLLLLAGVFFAAFFQRRSCSSLGSLRCVIDFRSKGVFVH